MIDPIDLQSAIEDLRDWRRSEYYDGGTPRWMWRRYTTATVAEARRLLNLDPPAHPEPLQQLVIRTAVHVVLIGTAVVLLLGWLLR